MGRGGMYERLVFGNEKSGKLRDFRGICETKVDFWTSGCWVVRENRKMFLINKLSCQFE